MRKDLGVKPAIYPMPVLVIGTYDENGTANAMTAAWAGISEFNEISICIDNGHKTAETVVKSGAFTVSVTDKKNLLAADFVGVVSGHNDPDKLKKTGWTVKKSDKVNAPYFEELPMTLECKLKSYTKETCRLVGEIVNVSVDESILDEEGKITLAKFSPVAYDPVNHTYHTIGEKIADAYTYGLKLK